MCCDCDCEFPQIFGEIRLNGIKVYTLPEVDEDEEESYKEEVQYKINN